MSDRRLVSSRAALGVFCGGMLLLGGCAYIYSFDEYTSPDVSSQGSGGPGSSSTGASASTGTQSGSGGSGGSECDSAGTDCEVNTLASGDASANFGDIALGDTLVFWVQDTPAAKGTVQMRSKDTSAPSSMKLPISDAITVRHVAAVDDSALYAASEDRVIKVIKVNLPEPMVEPIDLTGGATGLALHMGDLYWPSLSLLKLRKGQPGTAVTLSDDTGSSPALIAANNGASDLIFWTYKGSGGKTGGVRRLDKAMDLVAAQDGPSGIATDGKDVYWVTSDGGIHSVPIDGVDPKDGEVPTGFNIPSGRIVVSGERVYWFGPDTAKCEQMPCDCKTGCDAILTAPKTDIAKAEVFAKGNWTKFQGLAADGSNVYWTAGTGKGWFLLQKAVVP